MSERHILRSIEQPNKSQEREIITGGSVVLPPCLLPRESEPRSNLQGRDNLFDELFESILQVTTGFSLSQLLSHLRTHFVMNVESYVLALT